MEFIIEGTVSEVTVNNDKNVEFKIAGTEGYAIKQDGNNYNIIFLKDHDRLESSAFVFEQSKEIVAKEHYLSTLQTAIANGKRFRFKFDKTNSNDKFSIKINDANKFILVSISLLSE